MYPTYPADSGALEVVLDVYRLLGIEHAAHDDEVYGVCRREEVHLNTNHMYICREKGGGERWGIEMSVI